MGALTPWREKWERGREGEKGRGGEEERMREREWEGGRERDRARRREGGREEWREDEFMEVRAEFETVPRELGTEAGCVGRGGRNRENTFYP